MTENKGLVDIIAALKEKLETPEVLFIRKSITEGVTVVNPVAGFSIGVTNGFLIQYGSYKFNKLLKGLESGCNLETRYNQLDTYIKSSIKNAQIVANLFTKTINAECPKVCIIYGLVLARHLDNSTEFTHEEMILCKALENATDYDLNNFKEIMSNYIDTETNMVNLPSDINGVDKYTITCDWCLYNRIFVANLRDAKEEVLTMKNCYNATKPAVLLQEYIDEVGRVWDYE